MPETDTSKQTAKSESPQKTAGERVFTRISTLRADRGISRRELADALGIHYQTVGYLERGEYSPSLHLALRIAAFFEVPVEFLFSTEPFALLGQRDAAE